LQDLERKAQEHKIAALEGFGAISEKNILQGIEFYKNSHQRFLLGEALPLAQQILEYLGRLKEIKEITVAGSLRRRKETIGDIDILVTSNNSNQVMDFFTNMGDC